MIVARLRIVFNGDLSFFDSYVNFKTDNQFKIFLNEIKNGLDLQMVDLNEVDEKDFGHHFYGEYKKNNKYYIVLLQ